jgi:hypothetical protein
VPIIGADVARIDELRVKLQLALEALGHAEAAMESVISDQWVTGPHYEDVASKWQSLRPSVGELRDALRVLAEQVERTANELAQSGF